ncbi:TlpA family protein disulfide reductase [Phytoactinopolyspora limicola]|uniref:TlpA family protein disulfide reductase n=1 Tax=Phytoactinopolyspora limicola TaxID=2715536 RepID=UPI00140E7355|nr:TlpA disulfide reductase family protein [Phytoactinopolyspora limicola]
MKARVWPAVSVAALLAGLVLVSCSDGQVTRDGDVENIGYIEGDGVVSLYAPENRKPAPEFSGPLLRDEGDFDLTEARGDVIVLNVWGSWCAPCRKEAPDLQAVYEEYADEGVRFIGVNTRDGQTETAARSFEDEFGITYPSVFDPHGEALLAFRDTLPPAAIPSTLVIDREGRMAGRVLGPIGRGSLSDMISDVLAEGGAGP